MRLLLAPLLKGFLFGVGDKNVKVTLREREPSALSRLLGARRIDTALHGVLVDERGTVRTGTWAPGLNARPSASRIPWWRWPGRRCFGTRRGSWPASTHSPPRSNPSAF